ncbi:MAG: phage holin family protein [Clostridiales bacterium]|jgi:putative membrane protein|nr:phage holin family protein [Clostridiales bacterium]
MKKTVINCLLSAVLLYVIAWLLPGFSITNFFVAIVASLVLGLVNSFIKPIIQFLSLPLTIITLGLFSLVINALMLSLTSALVPGFYIASFLTAMIASIILSLLNILFIDAAA